MIARSLVAVVLAVTCLSASGRAEAAPKPAPAAILLPSDADIVAQLDGLNAKRPGQAIVVGVVGPDGERVVARGMSDDRPVDGRTLFEIGSLTKIFTALLLADMAERGEVRLEQPARELMPAGIGLPRRGREITLVDLATHRSGLPRLPGNMPASDPENPYADYSDALMLDDLAGRELTRDVGSVVDYSNLGYSLLGHLLARRADMSFADLIRTRITAPLGMENTRADPVTGVPGDMARPHDAMMRPASRWDFPAMAGAGSMVSNAGDLLIFMKAALGSDQMHLRDAFAATQQRRADGPVPGSGIGLGWFILPRPSGSVLFHNGMTGGYTVAMALDPAQRTGVVVLANSGFESGVDTIALNVLRDSAGRQAPDRSGDD